MGPLDPALIRLRPELSPEQSARPALVGARTVSYGELVAAVRVLSASLLALPVRVGDRVAIWMDKQPRYVEAILASLQAGCAYVPLDGGQPPARVSTILADAEPVVVITDRRHLAALADAELPASVRTVVVADAAADLPRPGPDGVPVVGWPETGPGRDVVEPAVAEHDLAALLYTSGSTGTPKGVMISRRNLAEFVGWCRTELDVGPTDVFANHASFNFDLSTFDLFVALSAGAAVWVVEDSAARDPGALAAGIDGHGVTVWYSVPSVLHLLVSSGALSAATARALRYVVFAGEVFPVPQLRALAALLPAGTALYNFYGPTETNVCTYHRVDPEDLRDDEPLPIGRAVGDARLSVLDDAGQPVPEPGAVGELVVEGSCVTPGYWRRAADPAAAEHGRGRHPTGDLVSSRDGVLRYHGRKDRMVKLSGYRVELDEVEAVVLRHDGIAAAAVVLAEGPAGPRLALYYAARPGAARPSLLEIKRHCARLLPRYMLPQVATCLEDLPRLPNGKTDYRSLRGPTREPALAGAGPRDRGGAET